ncbi:MAG: RDD family protein [Gammaproteobacteria bacterium]|nr:RDD family protein [Gammaproteobacteria bacterium]NNC69031.1 RDD family protein [Gammaproteobacteria bacterium]
MQAKDYKQNSKQNVSLLRRFGAILYDSFLLLTALFVAAFLIVIPTDIKPEDSYFFLFQAYIFLIAYLFFAWFWTRDGQTLGMRTWKMKLVMENGSKVTWGPALLRFAIAMVSWLALGLGFLWSLWDKQHRTWHDIASKTKLIRT